jgi:RNA polymerase sigma-70 factor (ECF subfamily)
VEEIIDIEALKAGREDAFRVLVNTFQDRVFNTCLGFLENREEAEDAAQETFMEVYRSLRNFREEAKLSTWIYRIAVSKSLLAIRRKRRKKRFALFVSQRDDGGIEEAPDNATAANHPLAQLENKEDAEILYAAMGKLAESQRIAFTLNKIEGLRYEEIAEVMNVSLSSVESLVHRAKMNLQKRLYAYYKNERNLSRTSANVQGTTV